MLEFTHAKATISDDNVMWKFQGDRVRFFYITYLLFSETLLGYWWSVPLILLGNTR
ncbi:hypothetical protein [Anabaena sp. CCY 9402-a]|uniref:hypothetical protein n=1 Tax=Anabaena sp. CCY 9402-a TaxID=3103867 RepID=UPI0039C6C463